MTRKVAGRRRRPVPDDDDDNDDADEDVDVLLRKMKKQQKRKNDGKELVSVVHCPMPWGMRQGWINVHWA